MATLLVIAAWSIDNGVVKFFDDTELGLMKAQHELLELAQEARDDDPEAEEDIANMSILRVRAGDDILSGEGQEICNVKDLELEYDSESDDCEDDESEESDEECAAPMTG
jgi:hypothetical protein